MPAPQRRVRVAVVTDAIAPYHRGGKETRYAHQLPTLAQTCEARVYTMHWWPERTSVTVVDGVEYRSICPLAKLYKGARRSLAQAILFALACFRLLLADFDVIEADHMPYLQLFSLWAVSRVRRRPLVVTWNEVWGKQYWLEYLGPWGGALAWWVERSAMMLPDEILAISTATEQRLRSYLGDSRRILVIPMGVDLKQIAAVQPAPREDSADLLFVGRLLAHKGLDLLLDALTALTSDRPAIRLLIVGDGPERPRLENKVAELSLGEVVRFRSGVSSQEEVFALMKAAKVFVFPSLREGFGIAPLEALACGTKVVTTSHPDNLARHLVARSNHGYLAEPTAQSLAQAVGRALAGTAEAGPPDTWIRDYDWAVVANSFCDALVHACQPGFSSRRHSRSPEKVVSRC